MLIGLISSAQELELDKYKDGPKPEDVIDERYGITLYEPLNKRLGGDSVRNCMGYECNGWVEDHYDNGKVIHKGYYVHGSLQSYKNYFPNGVVERDFHIIDNHISKLVMYHDNGKPKSDFIYHGNTPFKWESYYENGNLEMIEEYDQEVKFYVNKKRYYENGTLKMSLVRDEKKGDYEVKEYQEDGTLLSEGKKVYNPATKTYDLVGKLIEYNKDGSKKK